MSKTSKRELEDKIRADKLLSQYYPMDLHLNALRRIKRSKQKKGEDTEVMQKQIDEVHASTIALSDQIAKLIDGLPEVEKAIIVQTYICGADQQSIADSLHYSTQHIRRMKQKALKTIGIMLREDERQ